MKRARTLASLGLFLTPSLAAADLFGLHLLPRPGATEAAREALAAEGVEGAAHAQVYILLALFNDGPFGSDDQILSVNDVNLTLTHPRQRFFHSDAPSAGDTPPDAALFEEHPTLPFDTFVTLTLLTTTPLDTIETAPATTLTDRAIAGAWFNASPENGLGQPTVLLGGQITGTPIAQLTVLSDCPINRLYLEGDAIPVSTGPVTMNPAAFTLDAPPITNIAGSIFGRVDGEDLALLMMQWGAVENCEAADFNDDGVVDGFDLATLLASWSGP